ncbi:MAG: outer membrane lipid asymmetry maintenance protein MlaD [Deltaproteobacteria bacterium]|nr:outer membrane lipid asymmetry maintenance protein MlaD [Deltaproteobacteria bacterium]MBW1966460.1 outer membrane lipid asymmetry maintenance protein MlaD [Deltaproteobacteria bacterium]MBW2097538.1 outer membrane lipid asymmetry maintenance protein MlaD [Deltaproteobacteria bacterium]
MKKYSMETIVGIFVFIGLICVGYLTVKLGKMELMGGDNYILYARFNSVSGLKTDSSVEMAGVEIGRVSKIGLDLERQMALVTLKIHKDVQITDDAIASIKTSGMIGDKFIRITPGGSDIILQPGETITETESAIDLEELISKYVFGGV